MLNFDAIPKDKPNTSNVVAGEKQLASVFKTQMLTSKTSGNEYLNVSFKLDKGGFVNENYFDSDKPFLQWKLGRLLSACGVTLSGNGTLKDVAKVIQGRNVLIDVAVNDRGYGELDYANSKDGIYPAELTTSDLGTEVAVDADVEQAIETDFNEEF